MADWFTSLLFAVGIGTWVYVKMKRRSNSPSSSTITAVFVGLIVFIVAITFLKDILHY